jgi:hypothetical protein
MQLGATPHEIPGGATPTAIGKPALPMGRPIRHAFLTPEATAEGSIHILREILDRMTSGGNFADPFFLRLRSPLCPRSLFRRP